MKAFWFEDQLDKSAFVRIFLFSFAANISFFKVNNGDFV